MTSLLVFSAIATFEWKQENAVANQSNWDVKRNGTFLETFMNLENETPPSAKRNAILD